MYQLAHTVAHVYIFIYGNAVTHMYIFVYSQRCTQLPLCARIYLHVNMYVYKYINVSLCIYICT